MTIFAKLRIVRPACIIKHFSAWSAGPCLTGRPPPVIRLGQEGDACLGNPEIAPHRRRLIVARGVRIPGKAGDAQALGVQAQSLRQKLVAPADRIILPVVAQRPVAQHLEKGQVHLVPHLEDIVGADALLIAHQALAGRMGLTQEKGHQRMHPGGGKEHAGIVLGDQRGAADHSVPPLLKEGQIHAA